MNADATLPARNVLRERLIPSLNKGLLLLAAIVLVAVAIRVAWAIYLGVDPNDGRFDDSVFYHNSARLLAEGLGYVNPYSGDATAHRPPGFPFALAVVYKLGGWDVVWAQSLNIAFAAVTVVLAYLIGRRVFDQRAAYAGALILALFPGQIYFSALVYAETMFAMVVMSVLLLALVWSGRSIGWGRAIALGGLIGVSALVRDEGVLLLLVVGVFWALTVRPWGLALRSTALAALGLALVLTPWTVRNAVQMEGFIPLRENAGGTVARHLDYPEEGVGIAGDRGPSLAETLRDKLARPDELLTSAIGNARAFYANDANGVTSASSRVAFPAIVREPVRTAYSDMGLEPPAAWFSDDFTPLLTPEQERPWKRLANGYFFAAGAAALVSAALCLRRRNQAALLLVVAVICWTLLFSVLWPSVTRYHFALGPIIAIMAGGLLVLAWDWMRSRETAERLAERR